MIKENLARVREKMAEAAQRAGREPSNATLVCVIKNASTEQAEEAAASGVTDIGENRVKDALSKHSQMGDLARRLRWHMIGHLQTNKVKAALDIFDTIHSLDSLRLAEEIDKRASSLGKRINCFVEVNTSGEPSKYGINPQDTISFITRVASLPYIHIVGLMTMAPFVDDAELTRPYFINLRKLKEKLQTLRIPNTDIRELSMGMSGDFEVAIEEGATFIRIGTAIFGR